MKFSACLNALLHITVFAPFYVPGENFTCLDKSATHPWSRVNDDYCDCRDGSDEPGTSACIDMKFYCENAGHKSKFIFSSFVNDKVCDCCDGSDEYLGYVTCVGSFDLVCFLLPTTSTLKASLFLRTYFLLHEI
ncbi:unnamed protein product [Dibothriocephalus latus]|uniref:Glucosidase II beta subunit N-terminal domain-containing protein n=1 Tax=Dibothriocephalus latus TaxID=60516 RepID=A0A3P6QZN9_DIBLA|nr:unnamed protein product [Dibothriocephalus latus]